MTASGDWFMLKYLFLALRYLKLQWGDKYSYFFFSKFHLRTKQIFSPPIFLLIEIIKEPTKMSSLDL